MSSVVFLKAKGNNDLWIAFGIIGSYPKYEDQKKSYTTYWSKMYYHLMASVLIVPISAADDIHKSDGIKFNDRWVNILNG